MTTKLGEALNNIVGPIVMGIIFFAVFAPVALIMRGDIPGGDHKRADGAQ